MQRSFPFSGLVEFATGFAPRPQITHVIFDFDGTLSLIREGWPEVMVPMFMEFLPSSASETEETKRALVYDDIMRLNGKQTIYQMMQ
jgi:phosphoglycolate phosphatase-like HAD superfamily hydrolase